MLAFLKTIEAIFGNYYFLLILNSITCLFKCSLFLSIFTKLRIAHQLRRTWLLLLICLICSIAVDTSWIMQSISKLYHWIDHRCVVWWIRMTWACYVVQFQALALFLETVVHYKKQFSYIHYLCCIVSSALVLFFIASSFANFNKLHWHSETLVIQYTVLYVLFVLLPLSALQSVRSMHHNRLPTILKKQYITLLVWFIFPYLMSEFIQLYPLQTYIPNAVAQCLCSASIASFLFTNILYFCTRTILGLHSFNIHYDDTQDIRVIFNDEFKTLLITLSRMHTIDALCAQAHHYLHMKFNIPPSMITFYIDKLAAGSRLPLESVATMHTFLSVDSSYQNYFMQEQIIVYDDLEFDYFYTQCRFCPPLLDLLTTMHADIILLMHASKQRVGYFVIERHARPYMHYNKVERQQLIIFANYVGCIINVQLRATQLLDNSSIHSHKQL